MKVKVITNLVHRDIDGEVACMEIESMKVIDWLNTSDKKWLMNHMHWAVHNDRDVNVFAVESN